MAYQDGQIEVYPFSLPAGVNKFKKKARNRKLRYQIKRDAYFIPYINKYHGYS